MSRKELDIMTAIFDYIHARENRPIRSCNDYWIEVDEANVSQEDLDRAVVETEKGPCEIAAKVKLAFIEVDQSVEPATMSEEQGTYDYSLAIHTNQQGPGFCVHFNRVEAVGCKFNHRYDSGSSLEL
jgi:hypothetical protein